MSLPHLNKSESGHDRDHVEIARQLQKLEQVAAGLFYSVCVLIGLVVVLMIKVF